MADKIEVTVTPTSLVTTAGGMIEANVKLHNLGQSVDQFTISINGLNANWYALPVSSVALFPNDTDNLLINFSPPKTPETEAGSFPFQINVAYQDNPDEKTTVEMTMEIKALIEPKLSISPQSATGRRGVYQVSVNNPGDNEVSVNLEASDTQGALACELQPRFLTIPGKGTGQARLEVNLGWMSFFRGPKEFDFQVLAIPVDAQEGKGIDGKLIRIPWYKLIRFPRTQLPRIRLPWLERPPVIDAFKVTTDDRIEFKLSWSVKRSKVVKLNGEDVERTDEKRVSPTASASYVLEASNKYGSLSKTVDIQPRTVPEAESSERIRASLSSASLKLQAGVIPETITIELQNLGDAVDKFRVEIEGIDNDWYSRSASSIALMPQAAGQVQITFQVPKKRGVKARAYPFAVIVHSQNNPNDASIVVGEIEVLPLVEYKLKVSPYRVSCRRKGKFRVSIANTGMSEARIYLEATDLDEGLLFKFKNEGPVLAPWETIEIPLTAKPKRGSTIGERKRYDITITAKTTDELPQTANCELNHQPLMASWNPIWRLIKTIIVLGIIGVGGYYLLKLGGGWGVLSKSPQTWVDTLIRTIEGWFFR
ncbi:hypothetical protein ACFLYL_00310 [Chloroflexota bacterium]